MNRLVKIGEDVALEMMDPSGLSSKLFYLSCKPHHLEDATETPRDRVMENLTRTD